MAIRYGSGIKLALTIGFTEAAPLDNRSTVEYVTDLESINAYIGLMTYVIEKSKFYVYTSKGWTQFNQGTDFNCDTLEELDLLKQDSNIEDGANAYVTSMKMHMIYDKDSDHWRPLESGVPIFTANQVDALGLDNLPDEFIHIPSYTDLEGETTNSSLGPGIYSVNTKANGTYLHSIFSTLRILQAEVAKIKNTFNYGLYSYTGKDTAMSAVNHMYNEIDDAEPLWAIEEDDLQTISGIEDVKIGMGTNIQSIYPNAIDASQDGKLTFLAESYWEEPVIMFKNVKDPKLFLYLQVVNKNIRIHFHDIDYDENNPESTDNSFNLDLQYIPGIYANNLNILVVVSRRFLAKSNKEHDEEPIYNGHNFIWVSISNSATNQTIAEGYWKNNILYADPVYMDAAYIFNKVTFAGGTSLSKMKIYSKYQDFSKEVIPSKPDDDDYRYKVSHITIRSVKDYLTLSEIKAYLPENELIFEEQRNKLWIKNNGQVVAISGAGSNESTDDTETMTQAELIKMLQDMGMITDINTSTGEVSFNSLSVNDIVFIDQASGKSFIYATDAYGNLVSTEIPNANTKLSSRLAAVPALCDDFKSTRGFVGQLGIRELSRKDGTTVDEATDLGLYSDRIKISSIYAPLETDVIHGCTHGFIELENTSDIDFDLSECYLHFAELNSTDVTNSTASNYIQLEHLKLTGTIKAGSTYLIRCKQYANMDDANAFIKVNTFDQEWYVTNANGTKSLLDMTGRYVRNGSTVTSTQRAYGIALTYGEPTLTPATNLWQAATKNTVNAITKAENPYHADYASTMPMLFRKYFIDAIQYGTMFLIQEGTGSWASDTFNLKSNSIIKNMFALDPAKQAYNAFTTVESSRARWAKKGTDQWTMSLNNEFITFPHTDEVKAVADYTPKASFENKNVITDKSMINMEKPNMVTCAFGINMYTTRCFNWISAGLFNEYVWIRVKGSTTWDKFESYKSISTASTMKTTYPRRFEYNAAQKTASTDQLGIDITNSAYARITSRFPGNNVQFTSHKCIVELRSEAIAAGSAPVEYEYIVGQADKNGQPLEGHVSNVNTFTLYPFDYTPQVYMTTDQQGFHWVEYQVWAGVADVINDKIEYDKTHKLYTATIDKQYVKNTGTLAKPVYTLVADAPLPDGCVKVNGITSNRDTALSFTVSYTDDSGATAVAHTNETFTIDESNAAKNTDHIKNTGTEAAPVYTLTGFSAISNVTVKSTANPTNPANDNNGITYTLSYYKEENTKIIPVLMNSGDMTQNGTRINEWFDYYTGGKNLFNHLEQMNVVGNNDLCNTDITILGTGDDEGKSNSYFYHMFYCYQVSGDVRIAPVIKGSDNKVRYIPSLYFFESAKHRFVMINSEITEANCYGWFKLANGTDPVNIYTGWSVPQTSGAKAIYKAEDLGFTPIYTMLYNIFNNKSGNILKKKCTLAVCHEMPFTVITNSSLTLNAISEYRSGSTALIGSHLNQISINDVTATHWFSRLLEYFNIQLVLGGHKHTYACTYPIREYFYFDYNESTKQYEHNSKDNYALYTMTDTLKNDNVCWVHAYSSGATGRTEDITSEVNLSKFPIVESTDFGAYGTAGEGRKIFYPYTPVSSLTNAVTYFMCQASGYKLTSNKELPSANQKFARFLPQTKVTVDKSDPTKFKYTDGPASDQQVPMFLKVTLSTAADGTLVKNTNNIELVRVRNVMTDNGKFTQTDYATSTPALEYFRAETNDHNNTIQNAYGQWVKYENTTLKIERSIANDTTTASTVAPSTIA